MILCSTRSCCERIAAVLVLRARVVVDRAVLCTHDMQQVVVVHFSVGQRCYGCYACIRR